MWNRLVVLTCDDYSAVNWWTKEVSTCCWVHARRQVLLKAALEWNFAIKKHFTIVNRDWINLLMLLVKVKFYCFLFCYWLALLWLTLYKLKHSTRVHDEEIHTWFLYISTYLHVSDRVHSRPFHHSIPLNLTHLSGLCGVCYQIIMF